MNGTVYKSTGSWYTVKSTDGVFYECRIKGKFRTQGIKSTNPVAVGDHVTFELGNIGDETVGVISGIGERKNYIIRKSVKLSKQTHIIASNLDQVFLLVTLNNPMTFTSFIDRFLLHFKEKRSAAACLPHWTISAPRPRASDAVHDELTP